MRRLLTALAALALLLTACGDDDDAAEAPAPTSAGEDAADADGAGDDAPADGTAVVISDFAFDPETVEVAAGDTVTWTNDDGVAHTVTAGSSGAATDDFDEAIDAGESAEITFDEAGTYDYFCAIHPTMTGEVVVS